MGGVSSSRIAAIRSLAASSFSIASAEPVVCMSAKAFHLSHTLLSRLVNNARQQQQQHADKVHAPMHGQHQQLPTGIIVANTARHLADVRQPSRDVCMLLSASGPAWQQQQQTGSSIYAGGRPNALVDQSPGGSRSAAISLVLLGMEVAEGGCHLGLYVTFPNVMPQPLLVAAQDSCQQLLAQVCAEGGHLAIVSTEAGQRNGYMWHSNHTGAAARCCSLQFKLYSSVRVHRYHQWPVLHVALNSQIPAKSLWRADCLCMCATADAGVPSPLQAADP